MVIALSGVISNQTRAARLYDFEITWKISDQNCMTQSSIATLLYPF